MVKAIFSSDGEGERQKGIDFYDHLNMKKRCSFYTRGNEGIVCFQRKGFVFGVVNKHSCAFSFEEGKSCSLSTCSNIPCYFGLLRYVECSIKSRILLAFLETESSLSSFSGPIHSQKTAGYIDTNYIHQQDFQCHQIEKTKKKKRCKSL